MGLPFASGGHPEVGLAGRGAALHQGGTLRASIPTAPASREKERRLLEVPAEVDLGTGDLVLVVKGENLGIPSPSTAGGVGLIGNDHLVARLDQPDELEVLAAAGAGPATLEVAVTVELWVRWRREEKVIAQALLEEAPVAGCKRGI